MKTIHICLLLSLMVHAVLKASGVDPSLPPEESVLSSVLSAIAKPDHPSDFDACFPPLTIKKDIDAKRTLLERINRMYGAHLRDNPDFYRLITPLIKIELDSTVESKFGYHMSFVWSDFRLSYLKLCTETIRPPVFTYDSALAELEKPNGQERYNFFMTRASFPQPVVLSRTVWANIFTITEAQFLTLNRVLNFLDKHPDLKETHIQSVFESTFGRSIWDEAYWKKFIAALSSAMRGPACLPTLVVR